MAAPRSLPLPAVESRHCLVTLICAGLEWHGLPPQPSGQHSSCGWCLQLLGLKSLYLQDARVVPAPMAVILGWDLHCHKAAAPTHGVCCSVRNIMAWTLVQFWLNNQAVVAVLSTHSARNPQLMHLLRCLFFFQSQFGFDLRAQNISGSQYMAADALSCNHIEQFCSLFPKAPTSLTHIPISLLQMLLDPALSGTSPYWSSLLGRCVCEVLQSHLSSHTLP